MAANLNPFNVGNLISYISNFLKNIPPETKVCFGNSSDVADYRRKLGIYDLTMDKIIKRAEKNVIIHLGTIVGATKSLNRHFEAEEFEEVGSEAVPVAKLLFNWC